MDQPIDVDEALAWREAGDGPLVLPLHGLGGSRTAWEPQMLALSDRFRCVAWDMPGYRASAPLDGRVTFDGLASIRSTPGRRRRTCRSTNRLLSYSFDSVDGPA